jgi:hypothetical protein
MLERRGGALVLVEVQPKVKVVFNNLGCRTSSGSSSRRERPRVPPGPGREGRPVAPRGPLTGPDENIEFPIVGTSIKVGGDLRSTIVLKHAEVEARHCEVYRTGDSCSVRDLGTRFGTFVGKAKINDQPLHAGDIISSRTLPPRLLPGRRRPQGVVFPGRFPDPSVHLFMMRTAALLALALAAPQDAVREIKDLAYVDGSDADPVKHKLDLYLPKDAVKAPVVLWIHGGAWKIGRPVVVRRGRPPLRRVGHRLRRRQLPPLAEGEALRPHRDCARAFAWLRAHVAEYGGDPDRLFVSGQSAGGHLSALLASTTAT